MSDKPYEVGYGRPPGHSRFKPGQSGNPQGSTRKPKGVRGLLAAELSRRVPIVENGRRRTISLLEAAIRQLVTKAAGGDQRAIKQLFTMTQVMGDQLLDATATPSTADSAAIDQMVARILKKQGEGQ